MARQGPMPAFATRHGTSWGHEGRHYASSVDARQGPRRPGEEDSRSLESVLESAQPGAREAVERGYRQWNAILRDYLRTETALRLTVGDDARAVPVRVASGMPREFGRVLWRLQGLEWLLMNRPAIRGVRRA